MDTTLTATQAPAADAVATEAAALIAQGHATQAVTILQEALAAGSDDPRLKHQFGRAMLALGRAGDAATALVEATDAAPDNAACTLDLCRAIMALGMDEQAVIVARRAVELDPLSEEAFLMLARVLERTDALGDALQALYRCVDILRNPLPAATDPRDEPQLPPLHVGEGTILFLDYEAQGGAYDLCITSTAPAGAHRVVIKIADGATTWIAGSTPLDKGTVPRERLLRCLPPMLAAKVELYPGDAFDYALYSVST